MADKHSALTDPEAAAEFVRRERPWTPHWRHERVSLTQSWDGKNHGLPLCRASVHDGRRGVGFHQCTLPGVEQTADPEGHWWCRIHGPTGVAKRAVAAAKKRADEDARRAASRRRLLDANPHVQALLRIAQGDNDPRSTAREALGNLWAELAGEESQGPRP